MRREPIDPKNLDKLRLNIILELRLQYASYRLFRVWPEWSSPGLWMPKHIGEIAVGGYIEPEKLSISTALAARFHRWQADYDEQSPPEKMMDAHDQCIFDAEGLNIPIALSFELDEMSVVEYEIEEQRFLFNQGDCVCVFASPLWPFRGPVSVKE